MLVIEQVLIPLAPASCFQKSDFFIHLHKNSSMFFWFSKVFEFLFSPLTWIIIALILAFFLRKPRFKRISFITALVLLFVFTNDFLASEAMRLWEIRNNTLSEEKVYDAAIVLGGGMITRDAAANVDHFRKNTDRLMQALKMYHDGRVKRIVISGGSGSIVFREMPEACLLKEFCGNIGLDTTDIIAECRSDNTYENALYTVDLLNDSIPGGDFLLITSSSHMRRARAVFQKTGLEFDYYCTNPITGKRRYDFFFLIVPSTSALQTWEIFFRESLGYVIYKIAGYL